jgi:hypothetical protein
MSAKDLVLRPIPAAEARRTVERLHYSGSAGANSQLHIGVFYGGALEGAMQFGPSLDQRRMSGLVSGSGWHEFTELNRMAFSENLPRNSESRALSVAFRLIRKHAPQLKWVVSFADGAQCGDGAIYRASGFLLTGIKENSQIMEFPGGERVTRLQLTHASRVNVGIPRALAIKYGVRRAGGATMREWEAVGARPVPGYQFRYVYFLDPAWRSRLAAPVIPFDQIPAQCRMYRGVRGGPQGSQGVQPRPGGASPTPPLHTTEGDDAP